MKQNSRPTLKQLKHFAFGFFIGIGFSVFSSYNCTTKRGPLKGKSSSPLHESSDIIYNDSLANKLYDEVKLLCWVMTAVENHKTKAIHVKNTWGKRCNKILFISTQSDVELDTVALPVKEGRDTLWDKTRQAFIYIHQHHFNDADWFLKADDDNYVFPENIRYMLSQYRPQTALYFGHRFASDILTEGYMAGGGYILSKKALEKLATKLFRNATVCNAGEEGSEDVDIGKCLRHSAIFVDERDELNEKRFFPVGLSQHFGARGEAWWYSTSMYYAASYESLKCCSSTPAAFHYVEPREMYLMEYLTQYVNVFGLDKEKNDSIPRKLPLKEILSASDADSSAEQFIPHPIIHDFDDAEIYKK